ncbi:hypothetical protein WJX72_006229 [[Myrmecia] bisecta]|uniref:VWFA domain-containing protein n=1 Tax=[Myrmecia] bisecta TaxID=41462 RepID=A0AAW1P207_9CHLO
MGLASKAKLMGTAGVGQPGQPSAPPLASSGAPGTPPLTPPQPSGMQASFPGQQNPPGQFGAQPQQGQFGAPPAGYPALNHQQSFGAQPAYPRPSHQSSFGGQQSGIPQSLLMPGGGGPAQQAALQNKLQSIVATNQLQYFYPPPRLQAVVTQLNTINFQQLATQWRMPMEMAYDLATLALYDIVIFADDSGSMVFEENGERIDDLKLILGKVSEVATLFDDDGILVRFMNSPVQGNGIRDSIAAGQLIQQVQFTGLTPLGTKLHEKVLQPFLYTGVQQRDLQKPILVIAITDGEPVGEPKTTTAQVIKNAKQMVANSPYGPGAVAFEFAQVGKDQKAQAFLGSLDNDPEIGKIIDATSYYELEAEEYARKGVTLTPELWLVKLMVGAVDPSYDEQD